MPQFLYHFTNASSCFSVTPKKNKIKWENFCYLPIKINNFEDILDPYKLLVS